MRHRGPDVSRACQSAFLRTENRELGPLLAQRFRLGLLARAWPTGPTSSATISDRCAWCKCTTFAWCAWFGLVRLSDASTTPARRQHDVNATSTRRQRDTKNDLSTRNFLPWFASKSHALTDHASRVWKARPYSCSSNRCDGFVKKCSGETNRAQLVATNNFAILQKNHVPMGPNRRT